MKSYVIGIGFFTIFGFFLFFPRSPRYQITNAGDKNAIVIDAFTGEAWITDRYYIPKSFLSDPEEITYFKPIGYCDQQKESYNYTPDEKRNNRNSNWYTWLKRIINQ